MNDWKWYWITLIVFLFGAFTCFALMIIFE